MAFGRQRVALVTGASSGIGAAIAHRLASAGLRVFGASREIGRQSNGIQRLPLDVTDDASVHECVSAVLMETEGRLDVLVNNAGTLVAGAVEEVGIEEARKIMDTNYFGVARMVKAVLPTMRKSRAGYIVTITGVAGMVPVPFWGHYNASKSAVEALMETLRFEVEPFGVKVANVEPFAVKTPMWSQPKAPAMPEYSPWRERSLKTMDEYEERAPGPAVVADVVLRIVNSDAPPLHNRITREAQVFPLLRRVLPHAFYERGMRRGFHLDSEGYERH